MLWWQWVALGFALAALELVTPGGFFVIFFGAGAILVGLLSVMGLGGPLWFQWLLFTVLSVGAMLVFRSRLVRWLRAVQPAEREVDSLVGEVAIPLDEIAPGQVGRAELRGSVWSARNGDTRPLPRGARAVVTRVDGLLITITAEGGS